MSTIQLTSGTTYTYVGGVVNFHLEGTTDCPLSQITIRVVCQAGGAATFVTVAIQNGVWFADLNYCKCNNLIEISAKCGPANSLDPYQVIGTVTLPCAQCCPIASSSLVLGQCNGSLRTVTLQSSLTVKAQPCPGIGVSWNFGDGTSSPPSSYGPFAVDTAITHQATHSYVCGQSYSATMSINQADGFCPAPILNFAVPCCDCCPVLSIELAFGPCDAQGNRQVVLNYTITPSDNSACPAIDGSLVVATQTVAVIGSSPLSGTVVLTLAPGPYSGVLSLTSPPGCDPIPVNFDVPSCDCCPSAVVTAEVKEECNSDHETKSVDISAVVIPKPACTTFAAMSVDGTQVATGSSGGAAPITLSHTGDYKCGRHVITVSYPGMDCPDGGGEFCVSVCETPSCHVHRVVFEFLCTVAKISWILLAFIYIAVNNTTVKTNLAAIDNQLVTDLVALTQPSFITQPLFILAALATLFSIGYYFIWRPCKSTCKPCRFLLALWQILMAGFLGFLLLSRCTFLIAYVWLATAVAPWLAIVIIILIVVIIVFLIYLLYIYWIARCCPTRCERLNYLFEMLVLVCGPAFLLVAGVIGNPAVAHFWLPSAALAATFWAALVAWVGLKRILQCP
ncbi:MAG: hypothetical protein AABN95_19430 [Acidobacteriota bacterium]